MRQITSNLKTGETALMEVPIPSMQRGEVLIATSRSLVSQGTEKMLVQFGKASLLQKARSQPDKVRQVFAKIRTDGLIPTLDAVYRRLDEPLPLGYCQTGTVIAIGEGVQGFAIGDRVASNGPHAEVVAVPANLCAKVPAEVSDDAAAFTVVGAVGLQGIRLIKPELGETIVVIGLGLIGQITAQLLQAAGCRVIGFDFDPRKAALAASIGITAVCSRGEVDSVKFVSQATGGLGADAVIITASTSSSEVISQSARMSRKRGRIVLVGVIGLQLNRADFYEKELTFQVSCSYGPGRYDDAYEEKGYDYPPGYVRWTENRNFDAVLQAMSLGRLQVEPLVTRRVPFEHYNEIYENMSDGGLASLLVYGQNKVPSLKFTHTGAPSCAETLLNSELGAASTIKIEDRGFAADDTPIAVVGAGNFTKMTVMPALTKARVSVKTIVSASGVSGTSLARKYNVPLSSTDFRATVADPEIRGIIITTRHNLHATQAMTALKAGKHVLVEKPLCLTFDELAEITEVMKCFPSILGVHTTISDARVATNEDRIANTEPSVANAPTLSVGFNRRFSPHVVKMKELLRDAGGPISIVATMNAGAIPLDHWVHDPQTGGGRLVGEACHFIDLAIFLTHSLVASVSATALSSATDTASILLQHENGSTSVINYFANGHRDLAKERIEVYSSGRVLVLDNFRELRGYGFKSFSNQKTKQDKGHAWQFKLFAELVKSGGPALISWPEVHNSTLATLAVPRALAERRWIELRDLY